MSNLSQFGGGGTQLGEYSLFSSNQGNLITRADGSVYLKSGVIAPTASYPTVPAVNTAYLNPLAPVTPIPNGATTGNIGSGGRWVSISINPETGYPLVLSDSPYAPLIEIRGLSTTTSADCSTAVGASNTAFPSNQNQYAFKYKRIIHHKLYMVYSMDPTIASGQGTPTAYGATYKFAASALNTNAASDNASIRFAMNAMAANPAGALVFLPNASGATGHYSSGTSIINGTTAFTLPTTGTWTCCAWGSNIFVALRTGVTNAASSPTGAAWTARAMPSASAWTAVASSGTLFVAVASGGTAAASSADGLTWTARTLPVSANWSAVTYSSTLSLWCAVASDSSIAATSPDGITWTQRTLPTSAFWTDVKWSPTLGAFITVASDGLAGAAFSLDGITWTLKPLPATIFFSALIAGGGTTLYAIGDTYGLNPSISYRTCLPVIAKSTDSGVTWKYYQPNVPIGFPGYNVIPDTGYKYGGGRLYCAYGAGGAGSIYSATSTDGITWTQSAAISDPQGLSNYASCMTYNGSVYLLITDSSATTSPNTNTNWTSTDGLTWTAHTFTAVASYMQCTSVGSTLLAYGNNEVVVQRSTDNGVTWTSISAQIGTNPYDMFYDSARNITFIAGLTNQQTLASIDGGLSWSYWVSTNLSNTTLGTINMSWTSGGNGKYTSYLGNIVYTGNISTSAGSNLVTVTGMNPTPTVNVPYIYSSGYTVLSNRQSRNARHNTGESTMPAAPVLQGGINYFTNGYSLLKMDTQNYIENTQQAGERNFTYSSVTPANAMYYYMRVQ